MLLHICSRIFKFYFAILQTCKKKLKNKKLKARIIILQFLEILQVLQTLRKKPNLLKADRCARNVSYTATSVTHIYSHFQFPFT